MLSGPIRDSTARLVALSADAIVLEPSLPDRLSCPYACRFQLFLCEVLVSFEVQIFSDGLDVRVRPTTPIYKHTVTVADESCDRKSVQDILDRGPIATSVC